MRSAFDPCQPAQVRRKVTLTNDTTIVSRALARRFRSRQSGAYPQEPIRRRPAQPMSIASPGSADQGQQQLRPALPHQAGRLAPAQRRTAIRGGVWTSGSEACCQIEQPSADTPRHQATSITRFYSLPTFRRATGRTRGFGVFCFPPE